MQSTIRLDVSTQKDVFKDGLKRLAMANTAPWTPEAVESAIKQRTGERYLTFNSVSTTEIAELGSVLSTCDRLTMVSLTFNNSRTERVPAPADRDLTIFVTYVTRLPRLQSFTLQGFFIDLAFDLIFHLLNTSKTLVGLHVPLCVIDGKRHYKLLHAARNHPRLLCFSQPMSNMHFGVPRQQSWPMRALIMPGRPARRTDIGPFLFYSLSGLSLRHAMRRFLDHTRMYPGFYRTLTLKSCRLPDGLLRSFLTRLKFVVTLNIVHCNFGELDGTVLESKKKKQKVDEDADSQ